MGFYKTKITVEYITVYWKQGNTQVSLTKVRRIRVRMKLGKNQASRRNETGG